MRARAGGPHPHAAAARGTAEDLSLETALLRLAEGDFGVRLPVAPGRNQGAKAFNQIADRLMDALADPAVAPMQAAVAAAQASTGGRDMFVAIIGLGRFSELRRQLGAELAADILQACCDRLVRHVPGVRLGRVGRTQIEILFPAPSAEQAEEILERARGQIEQPLEVEDQNIDLDVAIGYARVQPEDEEFIENAALALARAQSGHAKIAGFSIEERRATAERVQLMKDLHRALAGEGLFLCYQPKFRPRTGSVDSLEALIRWNHPRRGLTPPDQFIGLAEETGAIAELTRWVVLRTIADQARLAASGHALPIYVNLSGRLVADAEFTQWLLRQTSALPRGAIGMEITETAIIEDPEHALANLQRLADAGIPISIDDFGSGVSSLAYLKQLPATELKIDRLFISSLTSSHRDPLLVRSTIDLAHALEMEVTAEGVENAATLALLRTMGCDLIQGYFISKPLPLDALTEFLDRGVEVQTDFSFMQTLRRRAE